jgi:putative two-component system response regulator
MKTHTTKGEKIIDKIIAQTGRNDYLDHARIFAGAHHEKWDGSGYPRSLKGEEIPLQGRIMALIDVYDALVSRRPYKEAYSHQEALSIISNEAGTHFDPDICQVFLSISDQFLAGWSGK